MVNSINTLNFNYLQLKKKNSQRRFANSPREDFPELSIDRDQGFLHHGTQQFQTQSPGLS